jgi:hypothetical protein
VPDYCGTTSGRLLDKMAELTRLFTRKLKS